MPIRHPTPAELAAAADRRIPDILAPDLKLWFCGINPGLYSAWAGHHFARPGNRFWRVIHAAGFTPELLHPSDDGRLLTWGYGLTNLVERPTAGAAGLSADELRAGWAVLEAKIHAYQPGVVAVLGISAYRLAFDRPRAGLGLQPERVGQTALWVLPNPSGLNAHYGLPELI
ncbi:MAG: G/U mismatch-specific DNA glycosylase, partial [Anaerolineae bacterium]|nr:G/U mismatch-specific DNA glycosylase [Caldilineales bacterium]MDW8270717.1 G/U mismatch-specific DNA glycosylase [Anaerolineae bacterium]